MLELIFRKRANRIRRQNRLAAGDEPDAPVRVSNDELFETSGIRPHKLTTKER